MLSTTRAEAYRKGSAIRQLATMDERDAPLVSVVVPAFNEEKYIGACLHALSKQRHPGFEYEVIVVDDGSTDRTRAVALSYGATVISQPNRGVAKARQAGFEAARGLFIASTDADTLCPPQWLQRVVANLQGATDVVGVYGPSHLVDGSRGLDALFFHGSLVSQELHCALGKPGFMGFNFAVRRDAWREVGGFNTQWDSGEDVSLSLKLKALGKIKHDRQMIVSTSARRILGARTDSLAIGIKNYLLVFWLNRSGLPFVNYR